MELYNNLVFEKEKLIILLDPKEFFDCEEKKKSLSGDNQIEKTLFLPNSNKIR